MHTGELKRCKKILSFYSNHKLKPVAAAELVIKYKECEISAAEALSLIVCLDSTAEEHRVSSTTDTSPAQSVPILDYFPELICTTGTLSGTYTIIIDPNAKVVVHPV